MGQLDSVQVPVFEAEAAGYDVDYCAWLDEQARRLRLLRIPGVDSTNIAEEIEGLSRSDKRALASRVRVLLAHLTKWRYQPSLTGASWRSTIGAARGSAVDLLEESPSLRPTMERVIEKQYARAIDDACDETGLAASAFPATCEWTAEQILAHLFLPSARG